ncbi:MAG: aldose 1-epimerase family protein [Verrucomicrobiota bacterium]
MPEVPALFRQVLASTHKDIHLDAWRLDGSQVPDSGSAGWSIAKRTLHGGRQEGVDVVEIDNGQLRITVIPTRGMSILKVESQDLRLGWDSPVKEVIHPQYINLESRGGLGWLEGFNEWLVRCGLEWAGHPGPDSFRNNVGEQVEMNLTLHGKIGNIPASEVEVSMDVQAPHRIHLRGLVEERMFYGAKLSLWTDISTEPGSNSFRIEDVVINSGSHDQEFQLIYHANFGPPLLQAGSQFVGAMDQIMPFNKRAAENVADFDQYWEPRRDFIEQVYCLRPIAGPDGLGAIMLQNEHQNRGVLMSFPVQQLPCVTFWKNLAAIEDGYVTGLEPGTGFPYTRRIERAANRVPKLAPHEKRTFTIDVSLLHNPASVNAARQRIRAIQNDVQPLILAPPSNQ